MIIDGRSISEHQQLKTEICIVGGGPAGITIANEFINTRFDIVLVESGGLKFQPTTQALSAGKVVSIKQSDLKNSRRRQVGGNAHVWNAPISQKTPGWRCLPLESWDFESKDWIAHSGWPFNRQDLEPYYQRAHQICGLNKFNYAVEDWQQPDSLPLFTSSRCLETTVSQFARSSIFTSYYPQKIQRADNIRILINSTVLRVKTSAMAHNMSSHVTNLDVASSKGSKFAISAKMFILAAGGIENARLLLLSNEHSPSGLGNQHDLVGRFFMDHPRFNLGLFIPFSRQFFNRSQLYDIHRVNGSCILGAIGLKTELLIKEKLPNHGIHFYPTYHGHLAQAKVSWETIKNYLSQAKIPHKTAHHIHNIIRGHKYVTDVIYWKIWRLLSNQKLGIWSFLPQEKTRFSALRLTCQLEQMPIASNRLTLTPEQDYFSQNKIELHWQLSDREIEAISKITTIVERELNYSQLGYFQAAAQPLNLDFEQLTGYHHLGTTRMHSNPKHGVVDADCRLHGVNNLFIAGSSVFPTGGYANPTLTIIALAIKLADKIKAVT
ncbi:MAG: GMC family oxidoreductase [Cyanobacteria bacterium P01_C01_bin.72]